MRLYLMRHGKAAKGSPDAERPLEGRGRKEARAVAEVLARSGVKVPEIRHSRLRRARETAIMVGEVLGPPGGLVESDGLEPDAPVDDLAHQAAASDRDIFVVGHQPFLGNLASRLVLRRLQADHPVVALTTGAVVCLEHADRGLWVVVWLLSPEALGV